MTNEAVKAAASVSGLIASSLSISQAAENTTIQRKFQTVSQ